jgi:hypothetical protein
MSISYRQVWFMPWAGLKKQLKLGPIVFWPFSAAESHVPNKTLRKSLAENNLYSLGAW